MQQAWEQEEERRKKQAADRLAGLEAEALRVAEEERQWALAEAAEMNKIRLAAQKELMLAQQRVEANKRATAAQMANLKLPTTSKWATHASGAGSSGPVPLADILAAELQEQEVDFYLFLTTEIDVHAF